MGHFTGSIRTALDTATDESRKHAFYECLKRHGFYDVADEENGLKDWQRASVPEYNQRRMSALASALADMFDYYLGSNECGVLTGCVQNAIDKVDQRAAMTAGEMDTLGGVVGGLTGGTSEAARQAMSSAIAAAMGGFKFDPQVLPPICIGFNGLPISLSNIYRPGVFSPDYTFLYEWEARKEKGFYDNNGQLYIGAGIPVALGGNAKILVLRTVFAVSSVDENMKPVGDIEGGLTQEEFTVIQKVMDKSPSAALADKDAAGFELSEEQRRASFNRYIHMVLWEPLKNPNNWAYLHWGVLTNNATPGPVITAVCSFLRTNGLALDPRVNPEACMISYCLNAAMAYQTGRDMGVTLVGLPGQKIEALDDNKQVVTCVEGEARQYKGVKKDKRLANLHFTFIADILAHLTNGTSENDVHMRKRRIAEANLIYSYVGLPTIQYGTSPAGIPSELKGSALAKRGFFSLMTSKVYVNNNTVSSSPIAIDKVKISYQSGIDPTQLTKRSEEVVKYLAAKAGLTSIQISSLCRSPEHQGKTMANNYHNNVMRSGYGKCGRQVQQVYIDAAKTHPGKQATYVDDGYFQSTVRPAMIKKSRELCDNGCLVSNHCLDPNVVQAIDMSYKYLVNTMHCTTPKLLEIDSYCKDLLKKGILKEYVPPGMLVGKPKGEPAFHVAVWNSGNGVNIQLPVAKPEPGKMSPTGQTGQQVKITNPNLLSEAAVDAVFVKDNVDSKRS